MFLLSNMWERILNWIFVRRCVGCGCIVEPDNPLALCRDCAVRLQTCGQSIPGNRFYVQAVSAIPYEGATCNAMQRFKFHNQRYLGSTFAALLYRHVKPMPFLLKIDVVACVPMHPNRKRYYNQSAVIAKEFARLAGLPFAEHMLIKERDLPPLSKMGRQERLRSVRGAFLANNGAGAYPIYGKVIALIDDIYTSGATTGECAKVLMLNGAAGVFILTPCYAVMDKNYHTRMIKTVNTSRESRN